MKAKERRDRLFKTSRPRIRQMDLITDRGYGDDMKILWAAYKMGSFDLPELTQEEFAKLMIKEIGPYHKKWIVEDYNPFYKDGFGAVGMVCAMFNGWELEPHYEPFKWSSSRNILRSAVGFFQKIKFSREIGIVNVYALRDTNNFFKHITKYGVLRFATKIPCGDARGDRFIYYLRGRKEYGAET